MTQTLALIAVGAAVVWFVCVFVCMLTFGHPSRWAEIVLGAAWAAGAVAAVTCIFFSVWLVLYSLGLRISFGG